MPFGQRNIFGKIIKDIFKINETIKQRLFFYQFYSHSQNKFRKGGNRGIIIIYARNYSLDLDFRFGG
jgi:hypothetical protein